MIKLKKEIKNEFLKVCSVKKIVAIIIFVFLACFPNLFIDLQGQYSDNWREEVEAEIAENAKELEEIYGDNSDEYDSDEWMLTDDEELQSYLEEIYSNSSDDYYDALCEWILSDNEKLQYYLDNDISPNTSVIEFVWEILSSNFILLLMSILIFAWIFCAEKKSKTEQVYIARSIRRRDMIAAKLITGFSMIGLLYVAMAVIGFILGLIFFSGNGFGSNYVTIATDGTPVLQSYFPMILNSLASNVLVILFLTSITALVAVLAGNQLFAVLIPYIIWNLSGTMVEMFDVIPDRFQALVFPYALNYFTSTGSDEIAWTSESTIAMLSSILVYSVVFFALAVIIFYKQSSGRRLIGKTSRNANQIKCEN